MKCSKCGSTEVYHRAKTDDVVCIKCGDNSPKENIIRNQFLLSNLKQDIEKMIIENNLMLKELLKMASKE